MIENFFLINFPPIALLMISLEFLLFLRVAVLFLCCKRCCICKLSNVVISLDVAINPFPFPPYQFLNWFIPGNLPMDTEDDEDDDDDGDDDEDDGPRGLTGLLAQLRGNSGPPQKKQKQGER